MKKKLLFSLIFIITFSSTRAITYYTASNNAQISDNSNPSANFSMNPDGITGLTNPIITENDDVVLLTGAVLFIEDVTLANLSINGNCTIRANPDGQGYLTVRFGTILNNGILDLNDISYYFGAGDDASTSAGKIIGTPNGTTTCIRANPISGTSANGNGGRLIFKGGLFTTFTPNNIIQIPNGTFYNNTVWVMELEIASLIGQYQVALNGPLTVQQTGSMNLYTGVLKTSNNEAEKLFFAGGALLYGLYVNPTYYGYVQGTVHQETNAVSFYYAHVGINGIYKYVIIKPNSDIPSTYSVKYTNYEIAENNPLYQQPKCAGSNLVSIQAGEQYDIVRTSGITDAILELPYTQTDGSNWSGNVAPNNSNTIVMTHYKTISNCWERISADILMGNSTSGTLNSYELSNFGAFTFGYGVVGVLPVQNLEFTASEKNNYNLLQWHVNSQVNTKYFEIQYSDDAQNYKQAGRELAKTTTDLRYTFWHINPPDAGNVLFYRLKIVDNDGSFTYSNIVKLILQKSIELVAYPNPAKDFIKFQNYNIGAFVQINDLKGSLVLKKRMTNTFEMIDIRSLANGIYLITVTDKKSRKVTRFVKH